MKNNTQLKIFPGRGLSGKDIKNRLRNRTLQEQTFGPESYMLDENMAKFTKMSKVEQITAAINNAEEIAKLRRTLEHADNKQKEKMAEQEIERKVQEKLKELGKEQLNNINSK